MAAKRSRPTKQFIVTVGPLEYYDRLRDDFIEYFEGVKEYCVSTENYHLNNKVHIHAYLEFNDLLLCNYVRGCVDWFDGTVNVESVKSREMSCSILRKRMFTHSSIVKRVCFCSLTGHGLGLSKPQAIPALSSDHNPIVFKIHFHPTISKPRTTYDYQQANWSLC
jgi:hypothetical protein